MAAMVSWLSLDCTVDDGPSFDFVVAVIESQGM